MFIVTTPICINCKHYHEGDFEKLSCEAYPKGIPEEILNQEVDHRKPYKGDNGIQFKRKPK